MRVAAMWITVQVSIIATDTRMDKCKPPDGRFFIAKEILNMKKRQLSNVALLLYATLLCCGTVQAQWGAALGAGVDQMNRQQALDLQRQQIEIQLKQQEAMMRMQEMEQRRYQMEMEEKKREREREREAINAELEHRNKIDRIKALFEKTINEHGEAGKEAVRATVERTKNQINQLTYKEVEQTLSVELIEPLAKAERMRKNKENMARFMADYPQYKNGKNRDLLGKSMELVMDDFSAGKGPAYSDMYELLVLSHKRLQRSSPKAAKKQL